LSATLRHYYDVIIELLHITPAAADAAIVAPLCYAIDYIRHDDATPHDIAIVLR